MPMVRIGKNSRKSSFFKGLLKGWFKNERIVNIYLTFPFQNEMPCG